MQVHFGTATLQVEWPSCVACIGTFDGVHRGHQAVISRAVEEAAAREQPCVLITFDRHPAATLAPERCPPGVGSLASNLREFDRLGVGLAVVLEFDDRLSQTAAEDFLETILRRKLHATQIVLGYDFALGKDRQGTPAWLSEQIETTVVPRFTLDGARVSSSAIREAVADGRVEEAANWLGRPFAIEGIVVCGQKLGRELGFPTINISRSFNQVTPAHGVYAGVCASNAGRYAAAISIGVRPAVGGGPRTIEAFLLGYPGHAIYGISVSLETHRRLRDERNFADLEELKRQMAKDIEAVEHVIKI